MWFRCVCIALHGSNIRGFSKLAIIIIIIIIIIINSLFSNSYPYILNIVKDNKITIL
jgi:hypothetical protein